MNLDQARALVDRFDTLCNVYRTQYPSAPLRRGGRGVPTIMSMAAKHLSQETGQSVRLLHQLVWHSRRKIARAEARPIPKEASAKQPVVPRFNDYGVPLSESWIRSVNRVVRQFKQAERLVAEAGTICRDMHRENMLIREKHVKALATACSALASKLRAARPISLCPYCKGIDTAQKRCAMCESLGYLTLGQNHGIPKTLKSTTNRVIMVGHEFVPISDVVPRPEYEVQDEPV